MYAKWSALRGRHSQLCAIAVAAPAGTP